MTTYDTACMVVEKLNKAGFIAYFAGGWVRDFLMQHPSDDIDIATDASVEEIQKVFEKTIPIGVQFGIVVVVENNHHFEVATFRKDHGYEDGRRPIGIERASPQEDAQRRDFTINGMFYDPLSNTLFDFVHGKADLEKKIIRAIGNPHQRFLEDRLRMMRAARYACRFHFNIDELTQEAIKAHANALFPSVAIERVWQEFAKMKRFGNFRKFLLMLYKLHLLQTIFEELDSVAYEEIEERTRPIDHFPKEAPVIGKILKLFPESSLEKKLSICEFFKLSNQEKNFVKYYHQVELALSNTPEPYEWAYLYASDHFDICLHMALASELESTRQEVITIHTEKKKEMASAIHRIKAKTPLVTSSDLIKAGIPAGALLGKLLKEAERIAINENIESIDLVIEKLKQTPMWP